MSSFVITVDGPAASGKGTIAERLGMAYGLPVLDSGLLYRAVGVLLERAGGDLDDAAAATEAARSLGPHMLDDPGFRTRSAGEAASRVAVHPAVREALLDLQYAFARQPGGAILDGRDMGTVVFPDAELKVFLTASPEIRAERRYKQLIEKGIDANLRALSRDLRDRDERDAKRAVAPLVPAPDSQVLDSSALSIDEVVDRIVGWCRERKLGGRG